MSTKGEHINALPHGTGATTAFKTYTAESRATGRTQTIISKAAVHGAVQRSRALGDVTPMTEDDLWKRVAKDASAKPYKALALDVAGKARRQHDRAVETGLSNHERIETAAEARPQLGDEMKAAWQAGLLRQAFDQQRDALVALVQAIDEQLKRAAGVVADRARAIAAAIAGAPDASARDSPSARIADALGPRSWFLATLAAQSRSASCCCPPGAHSGRSGDPGRRARNNRRRPDTRPPNSIGNGEGPPFADARDCLA